MKPLVDECCEMRDAARRGWNLFWFAPVDPSTLCLIRILAGAMLFYTHLVWTCDLLGFLGPRGRVSSEFLTAFRDPTGTMPSFAWSYFSWSDSPIVLWVFHLASLVLCLLLTFGLFTRVVSVLVFFSALAYVHRSPVTTFGLDQINLMLAMYLMIGPSGARYSFDAWRGRGGGEAPSTSANIALRLMQIHLCIIYFFAGCGKLQGASWWEGSALWLAFANYEYQSIDMTWTGRFPKLINAMTQFSLLWEVTYSALIWPRWTRPVMLALAIPLHLGIGLCLGMMTFGTVMLIANASFLSPATVRRVLDPWIPATWQG